jgi:GT2 family glycosyltransferase
LKAGLKPQVFEGNIPDYNFMMWIDSDMIWKPTDIEHLMSWNKDIICGLAKMRSDTIATVEHWDLDRLLNEGSFEYLSEEIIGERAAPFPVAFTGMAFMLIKRGVLEKFDYPWIEPYFYELGKTRCLAGEDVSFCKKAQRLGFEVLVDPMVRIGHMKEVVLT